MLQDQSSTSVVVVSLRRGGRGQRKIRKRGKERERKKKGEKNQVIGSTITVIITLGRSSHDEEEK